MEEEEESGSLNEEEIKKMQSDEVCGGQPLAPSAVSSAEPSRCGQGATSLGSVPALPFSTLPSLP